MLEIKILKLVTKLQKATKRWALWSINQRAIRLVNKSNRQYRFADTVRATLTEYEEQLEVTYWKKSAAIDEAYKEADKL